MEMAKITGPTDKKVAGHSPAKSNREAKPMRVASTTGLIIHLGSAGRGFKNNR